MAELPMIKVIIELDGPSGRIEVVVEEPSAILPRTPEEWKQRVTNAASTAVKKIHGAIDG